MHRRNGYSSVQSDLLLSGTPPTHMSGIQVTTSAHQATSICSPQHPSVVYMGRFLQKMKILCYKTQEMDKILQFEIDILL